MEINRRTLEITLGAVFVILLLLISISIINCDKKGDLEISQNYIINNYNFYGNYNNFESTLTNPISIQHPTYLGYENQRTREEFLGNYVQEYYVYVLNKEKSGRYFTVVFEFEDKYGYEYSESITHYIKAGEKEKFEYRDIQAEGNEIIDWDYRIIPENY